MPRSAVSIRPLLVGVGARERAAHVAEQLGFEQRLGSAPQLSATNGRSRRSEWKCTARATSSLPVPDSPVMRTVLVVRAMVSTRPNTSSIAWLRPMMLWNWCDAAQRALEQHVFLPQPAALEFLADLDLQLVDVERLDHVVAGAEPHAPRWPSPATRRPSS